MIMGGEVISQLCVHHHDYIHVLPPQHLSHFHQLSKDLQNLGSFPVQLAIFPLNEAMPSQPEMDLEGHEDHLEEHLELRPELI